jgi:heptosyltransferase-1
MYSAATRNKSDVAEILVVRLGAMGDIVHTLPAVASIKLSFPRARLTWVVEPRWRPLLEGNRFIDCLVEFNRQSWTSIRGAFRRIRSSPVDLAVDFQGLVKSSLVALASRPERLFGYHRTQAREGSAAWFYSNPVIVHSRHIVDRNLELAQAAGAKNTVIDFSLPDGTPEGILPDLPYVLANPLAGWRSKQWPLEHYEELAKIIQSEMQLKLVLNGPSGAALTGIKGVHVHDSGLSGLIWATRRATAVVGVDSGPLHLAAALGKPGVAIFGPTDPERNGPYGSTIRVLRSPRAQTTYKRGAEIDAAMHEITPRDVVEAMKSVLRSVRPI